VFVADLRKVVTKVKNKKKRKNKESVQMFAKKFCPDQSKQLPLRIAQIRTHLRVPNFGVNYFFIKK
jgi:hypothetical protein